MFSGFKESNITLYSLIFQVKVEDNHVKGSSRHALTGSKPRMETPE